MHLCPVSTGESARESVLRHDTFDTSVAFSLHVAATLPSLQVQLYNVLISPPVFSCHHTYNQANDSQFSCSNFADAYTQKRLLAPWPPPLYSLETPLHGARRKILITWQPLTRSTDHLSRLHPPQLANKARRRDGRAFFSSICRRFLMHSGDMYRWLSISSCLECRRVLQTRVNEELLSRPL